MFPPACSLTAANGRTERKRGGNREGLHSSVLCPLAGRLLDWLVRFLGAQAESGSRSAEAEGFPTADLESAGSEGMTKCYTTIISQPQNACRHLLLQLKVQERPSPSVLSSNRSPILPVVEEEVTGVFPLPAWQELYSCQAGSASENAIGADWSLWAWTHRSQSSFHIFKLFKLNSTLFGSIQFPLFKEEVMCTRFSTSLLFL